MPREVKCGARHKQSCFSRGPIITRKVPLSRRRDLAPDFHAQEGPFDASRVAGANFTRLPRLWLPHFPFAQPNIEANSRASLPSAHIASTQQPPLNDHQPSRRTIAHLGFKHERPQDPSPASNTVLLSSTNVKTVHERPFRNVTWLRLGCRQILCRNR